MSLIDAETEQLNQGNHEGECVQKVSVAIYVAGHCYMCDYTYEVAEIIRQEYPQVDLQLIDLMDPTQAIPPEVFATPTYLLNGRVWSLGNPSIKDVRTKLSQALAEGVAQAFFTS
jgi:hypothetical protein